MVTDNNIPKTKQTESPLGRLLRPRAERKTADFTTPPGTNSLRGVNPHLWNPNRKVSTGQTVKYSDLPKDLLESLEKYQYETNLGNGLVIENKTMQATITPDKDDQQKIRIQVPREITVLRKKLYDKGYELKVFDFSFDIPLQLGYKEQDNIYFITNNDAKPLGYMYRTASGNIGFKFSEKTSIKAVL